MNIGWMSVGESDQQLGRHPVATSHMHQRSPFASNSITDFFREEAHFFIYGLIFLSAITEIIGVEENRSTGVEEGRRAFFLSSSTPVLL